MPAEAAALSFAILGRPFAARNVSEPLAAWLREGWEFADQVAAPHPFAIAVEGAAAAPPDAAVTWTEQEIAVPGRVLRFRNAGPLWRMGDERAGLRLELGDTAARLALWGEGRGDVSELRHGLYVALTEALRASGLVPLHAAVAARDGECVAWLGASGAGKSTTLLYAAAAGWRAIAEDLCWLEPESLRVHGWDRGVRCLPGTLERLFPGLDASRPGPDGKRVVAYDRLRAAEPRASVLTRLALLRRVAGGESHLEPALVRDAVKALWEATGVPLATRSRDRAATVIGRLGRLPAMRLVVGDDPPSLTGAWPGQPGEG